MRFPCRSTDGIAGIAGAALVWAPAAVWLALTGHMLQGVVVAQKAAEG